MVAIWQPAVASCASPHAVAADRSGAAANGPAVWHAEDFEGREHNFIYQLTDTDICELDAAITSVQDSKADLKDVTKEDFPLPTLGPRLAHMLQELLHGRGFQLVRGVPVERYSTEQSVIAFWGIGAHIGRARPQNRRQHLLGHVRDISQHLPGGANNPVNRTFATSKAQPFHVDECDVVGLLCLKTAKEGGHSRWASSHAIHNEMLRRYPKLYQELIQPLYVDRKDEIPDGKLAYYRIPVFNFHKGKLAVYYVSSYYQLAPRHPGVPELTERQHQAFAVFDSLAEDLAMNFVLAPGDIQFLHNHQVVHDRSSFTDYPEESRKRHLLRLWLAPEHGWPLPEAFAERYGSIERGNRGGIWISGQQKPNVPIDPKAGL